MSRSSLVGGGWSDRIDVKTVPYRPKTENEKPHFFIFSQFPTEKTGKKGLFSQFRATEKLETENLRFSFSVFDKERSKYQIFDFLGFSFFSS